MNVRAARDTQDLLDALDRYKEVRGTLEIFDVLFVEDVAGVYRVMGENLQHPLWEPLAGWLEQRGVQRPLKPTAAEILERRGITDVEAWIDEQEAELTRLRKELADARSRGSDALKAANGFSGLLFVLAAMAVLGWLAAFRAIPFLPLPLPEGKEGDDIDPVVPESTGPGANR